MNNNVRVSPFLMWMLLFESNELADLASLRTVFVSRDKITLGLFLIPGWPTKLFYSWRLMCMELKHILSKQVDNIKKDNFCSRFTVAFSHNRGFYLCSLLHLHCKWEFVSVYCLDMTFQDVLLLFNKKYLQIFNNTLFVYTTYLYVYLVCPWNSHKALIPLLCGGSKADRYSMINQDNVARFREILVSFKPLLFWYCLKQRARNRSQKYIPLSIKTKGWGCSSTPFTLQKLKRSMLLKMPRFRVICVTQNTLFGEAF